MSRRRATAALAAGVCCGVAVAALRHSGPAAPVAQASAPPLTVTTTLPAWRAEGVPLAIVGFAGSRSRVRLLANGRGIASTVSGRLGRYRLTFPAARAGRFRLTVADTQGTSTVGRVVVRPVVLDAVGDITFGEQVGPTLAAHGARYP